MDPSHRTYPKGTQLLPLCRSVRNFISLPSQFFPKSVDLTSSSRYHHHLCLNMTSLFQAFFQSLLGRNLFQVFHFILGSPRSQPSASFRETISRLRTLLETESETSESVILAMKELSRFSPDIQAIPKGVWPEAPTSLLCIKTHLKSTFVDAAKLIEKTGRNLSTTDEKYLHLILTHSCGWSATYPEHMNDEWVKYFETRYPQLKGLMPILDSMTYQEELARFPDGFSFNSPHFFLLATPDCYYVYDATDGEDELRIAGNTLEEVYTGLMEYRWAETSEDPWEFVEEEVCLSPTSAFPTYLS